MVDSTVVDTGAAVDTAPPIDTMIAVDTATADTAVAVDSALVDAADTGPTCTPLGTESCNGLDDDCNGMIDDGVPVVPCGVGACRVTPTSACTAGKPTVCMPTAPASSDTTCNGIDDDCNGIVDDGCITCARYVLLGSVGGTGLTATSPLGSIQAAINSLTSAGARGNVCVAATAPAGTCVATTYTERVTMAEGVSLFGGYKPGATWTRGDAACVTAITDTSSASPTGLGVYFGHSITGATQLDGFTVNGLTTGSPVATAAITMQGGGTVSNNVINGGAAPVTYAVNLTAPSAATLPTPLLIGNAITGASTGLGVTVGTSIGVRIVNMAPVIRNNRAIVAGTANNNSRGIEISSSGRGTTVTDNTLISGGAANLSVGFDGTGDVSNVVVARNTITSGNGSSQSRAISLLGCGTSSGRMSVLSNALISAAGGSSSASYGVVVQNSAASCSVLIDSNTKIVGKSTNGGNTTAIYCLGTGTTCTVTANARINAFDTTNTGGNGRAIHFQGGAGGAIRKNAALAACLAAGTSTNGCTAVHLEGASATVVDGNILEINRGGYPAGIRVRWTNATIQNNVVWVDGGSGIELDVRPSSMGAFEAVVHSNTVIAPPTPAGTPPQSALLAVDNETSSGPPNGVFRNNIAICLGTGFNRTAFREFGTYGDPRVLENNDLFGCATLYNDRETGSINSMATINALSDIPIKGGNVTLDPAFVSGDWHLTTTSPVIDLGTGAACPAIDHDTQPRPARTTCDIGADEVP